MSSCVINIKVIFIVVILNTGSLFIKATCNEAISDFSRLHSCLALCKPLVSKCRKTYVYSQLTCKALSAARWAGVYAWLSLEVRKMNIISEY